MKARSISVLCVFLVAATVIVSWGGCGRGKVEAVGQPRHEKDTTDIEAEISSIRTQYNGGSERLQSAYAPQNQVRGPELHRAGSTAHRQAYEAAKELVHNRSDQERAWFWLGVTAAAVGREQEAIEAYRKAIAIKEHYPEALNNLGDLYERQERWPEAIKEYHRALEIRPDLQAAYAGLGDVFRKNGAWKKAVENYERAIALDALDTLSQRYLEACRQARDEEHKPSSKSTLHRGIVSAQTLKNLTSIEPEVRGQAYQGIRGLGQVRGIEVPPDVPRLALHIAFARNKWSLADLSDTARAQLKEVAQVLTSPNWQGKRVALLGYTCSCGPKDINSELALKRAQAIRDYLVAQKMISSEHMTLVARGEQDPIADTSDENLPTERCEASESHSMNRRVVIRTWTDAKPTTGTHAESAKAPSRPSARVSFWWRPAAGGAFRPLVDGAVLHSGDQIKIFMQATHPCYAYVIHKGSAGDQVRVFPNPAFCKEAPAHNPLEPNRQYWLPRMSDGIPLDNTPGEEETLVYISVTPEPHLDSLGETNDKASEHPKDAPITRPSDKKTGEEVVIGIPMRGLGGVTVSHAGNVDLPANRYARVRFRHEP